MKILAIGNSFSQDATAFLRPMCEAAGRRDTVVNLYIPGCSLAQHWENVSQNRAKYEWQVDALPTGQTVSVADALQSENWDVVTLQQASHDSGLPKTYFPYLARLAAYVRRVSPGAAVYLHQTWAYDAVCSHPKYPVYGCSQQTMYDALTAAYAKAAKAVEAPLIPCGTVIERLRSLPAFDVSAGGLSLCRDGFHLSLTVGRYLAAAVWFETLTGGDINRNPFSPADTDTGLLQLLRPEIHRFTQEFIKKDLIV